MLLLCHMKLLTFTVIIREQQRCRDLDLITGFHLLDGEMHLFVLEGLARQGIRKIWETIGKPADPGK